MVKNNWKRCGIGSDDDAEDNDNENEMLVKMIVLVGLQLTVVIKSQSFLTKELKVHEL